jgi:hypothetical protein
MRFRYRIASKLTRTFNRGPKETFEFLSKTITGDETWVYRYNPET